MAELNGESVEFVRSCPPVKGSKQSRSASNWPELAFSGDSQDRCDRAETGDSAYTKRHEAFIRGPQLISTASGKTDSIDEWYCCRGLTLLYLDCFGLAQSFFNSWRVSDWTAAIFVCGSNQ